MKGLLEKTLVFAAKASLPLSWLALAAAAVLCAAGCAAPYYKAVDGTSTILGVSLPDEQYIQVNALSYLGGSKTYVREPATITHEYETATTNSYFGVVQTREWRRSSVTVCPTNCVGKALAE